MTGMLRVRRSRGALGGLLLLLLGAWGALIPFIGPYFHYAFTPDSHWDFTAGRVWLELLPGLVTIASGLLIMISRLRLVMMAAACLAALSGVWFAIGGLVARAYPRLPGPGTPVGGTHRSLLEQLGFFTGLGLAVVFVAAMIVGRFTLVAARDQVTADDEFASITEPARSTEPASPGLGRWLRLPSPVVRGRWSAADDEIAESEHAGWGAS